MVKIGRKIIIFGLWLLPLTKEAHEAIEPVFNGWVDALNRKWWKSQ